MTPKLNVEKLAILSSNIKTNEGEIRRYIAQEWWTLTKELTNAIILFIAGVHGLEDGRLSGPAESIEELKKQFSKFLEQNHQAVSEDQRKKSITFKFLDVKKFYLDENTKAINEEALTMKIREINPHIVVLAICFSKTLHLKFVLESKAIFSQMRMQRDLNLISKGKVLTLDQTQSDLLIEISKDENNLKTVVISGPEGSGKSLLAVEATKMKIYSLLKKHSSSDNVKIRVVLCAAYQGDNRVPVLFKFLKEELNAFENEKYCSIEIKPLADLSFNNVEDFQSKIQKELSIDPPIYTRKENILFTKLLPKGTEEETKPERPSNPGPTVPKQQLSNYQIQGQEMASKSKIRKPEETMLPQQTTDLNIPVPNLNKDSEAGKEVQKDKKHTIVLLDEVLPKFDLHQWRHLHSDSNAEYVVAIRHTFSQSLFETERLRGVSTLENSNTLVCVLDKRLRCSNEIIALIFYLMIHSKDNSSLKSFEHSLDSFNGDVPIWLDVEDVEDFIYFANTNPIETESVMVIYDPKDDDFLLQPVTKLCSEKKWPCHPCTSIVGSEATTVFLYNLKDFHFESFTRVTTDLIIITVKGEETTNQ